MRRGHKILRFRFYLFVLALFSGFLFPRPGQATTLLHVGNPVTSVELSFTFNSNSEMGATSNGQNNDMAGTIPGTWLGTSSNPIPIYCVDLADNIYGPSNYAKTTTTTNGTIMGVSGMTTVNNWKSVAYLVDLYGANPLSGLTGVTNEQQASAGLQAAIWKAIYGSEFTLLRPGSGSSTSTAAWIAYNTYINDIGGVDSQGNLTPNGNLANSALFISPAGRVGGDLAQVYEAQVSPEDPPPDPPPDPTPEPGTLILFALQLAGLAGVGFWKRGVFRTT